jgi:Bacteriophage HK97-gp10, putative tail-component
VTDGVSVEVRGLAELAQGSRILAGNIAEAAPHAFLGVADQVAGQVNVPRRTGRLAGSVEGRQEAGGASVGMGDGVPYARFVEFGGRGHPHSPTGNYLYPAAIEAESLLVAAAERSANDEIGRMRWPSP